MRALFGCVLLASLVAEATSQDSWPQWRGPDGDGRAHGRPPLEWSESKNVAWKTELPGFGGSTPVVAEDLVFVLTAIETERKSEHGAVQLEGRLTPSPDAYHDLVVVALDLETGDSLWEQVATTVVPHEGHHDTHGYASASPITDGEFLYVPFGSHGLYCYDLDGELVWQRDLGDMHTRKGWGEAASPALAGDVLIFAWDHEEESFLYGLDRTTGEVAWKVARDEPSTWTTPIIVEEDERTQVIVMGTNRVRSYDLATQEVIWECGGQTVNAIPLPVTDGQRVFCMSGYRGSLAVAVPLDARGDVTETPLWRHRGGTPYVPSPVVVDGKLFFNDGNRAMMSCLDAETGKVLIDRQRLPDLGMIYASPLAVNGLLYVSDREGRTLVLRPDESELKVVASNHLDDGFNASPVVVGDRLLLRGRNVYCIAVDAGSR